jgi:CBS domain-containing protein
MRSKDAADVTSGGTEEVAPPISRWTTVRDASAWMQKTGQRAVVVMDGDRPVGVITEKALRAAGRRSAAASDDALAAVERRERPDLRLPETVQDVMDFEVVRVDPSFGVEDTLRAYRDAAWKSVRRRHPFADHTSSS